MAIKDYYITGDDNATGVSGNNWRGQTFTAGSSYSIGSVRLKIYRSGTPGNVTVAIYDTASDKPNSSLTSVTIDGSLLDTVADWYEFTFSTPHSLISGTKYAIVVSAPSAPSNGVLWRMDLTSPTYAGGALVYSSNAGVAWSIDTSTDLMFETYSASSSYIDATGNFSITSGFDGVATVLNIIQATGAFNTSSSFSGVGSFTTFKDKTGTIAITSYLLGRLSIQSFFEWAISRPPIYDGTKVFDETSMSWIDNDGRGGGRFREAVIVIGQQADGISKILFQEL